MRRAGFAIVGIFLLKEELNGSIFLLTAVDPNELLFKRKALKLFGYRFLKLNSERSSSIKHTRLLSVTFCALNFCHTYSVLENAVGTCPVYSLFVLYYIADLENVILTDTSKEFSNVSL